MDNYKISYQEFDPDPNLGDFINCYWHFKLKNCIIQQFDIIPDGYFDLIIKIKNSRIIDSSITGIWNNLITITYNEDVELLGIRCKPLSLGNLFKFNIKELVNGSSKIELNDIKINKQIINDSLDKMPLIINYLNSHLKTMIESDHYDTRIKGLFEIIENSIGCESIDSISKSIGLCTRQIQRKIIETIGIGAKEYSKLVRFRENFRNAQMSNTNYCYYSGYYDQSHFIKDYKTFTGTTPKKLHLDNNVRILQYNNLY